jgi:hypothetical protein
VALARRAKDASPLPPDLSHVNDEIHTQLGEKPKYRRCARGGMALSCSLTTHTMGAARADTRGSYTQKPRVHSIQRVSQRGRIHRPERQQPGEGFGGYMISVAHTRRGERTSEEQFLE